MAFTSPPPSSQRELDRLVLTQCQYLPQTQAQHLFTFTGRLIILEARSWNGLKKHTVLFSRSKYTN